MTGTLLLALTLAQTAQPPGSTDPIEVGVLVTMVDGSTQTVSSYPRNRGVIYLTSTGSLCAADPKVGSNPPDGRSAGWKVELEPSGRDTRIAWRRVEEAAESRGPKNGMRTLPTAASGDWTAI